MTRAATNAAPRERPANFTAHSIGRILEGAKIHTRRVIAPQPRLERINNPDDPGKVWLFDPGKKYRFRLCVGDPKVVEYCPYGEAGDRLWVREGWRVGSEDRRVIWYKDDAFKLLPDAAESLAGKFLGNKWHASTRMYRWASRILLEIVSLRVERLQDITAEDCAREGVHYPVTATDVPGEVGPLIRVSGRYAPIRYLPKGDYGHAELMRAHFAAGWDEINFRRGYSWNRNPWVWVIAFRRLGS